MAQWHDVAGKTVWEYDSSVPAFPQWLEQNGLTAEWDQGVVEHSAWALENAGQPGNLFEGKCFALMNRWVAEAKAVSSPAP